MKSVFVSHASVDKLFCDAFVETVLKLGCRLDAEDIYYSSREDTGILSGEDLFANIRHNVGSATLVIAIISPAYQTRPICIAELGAAWGRAPGHLLPVLTPNMEHADLGGVLPSMLIRNLKDPELLDEICNRASEAAMKNVNALIWGAQRAKWLAQVDKRTAELPQPDEVTPEEVAALRAELQKKTDELKSMNTALGEEVERSTQLSRQCDELAKAASEADVERILMPKNEIDQFELLRKKAKNQLSEIPAVVRVVIKHSVHTNGPYIVPSWTDDRELNQDIDRAVEDGWLVGSEGEVELAADMPDIEAAVDAVNDLENWLEQSSTKFIEWFTHKHRTPPNLAKGKAWEAIFH